MKESLQIVQTGGSSITKFNSIFSHDSKYLLCPCGNLVKVFSVATGECFQRLNGHCKLVTMICHHPRVQLQILSSSLDGTVKVWDYEDGILLSTCDFNVPLLGIFAHSCYSTVAFVIQQSDDSNELYRFTLNTIPSKTSDIACSLLAKNVVKDCSKRIAFSEKFAVVSYSNRLLVFINPQHAERDEKIRHVLKDNAPAITCISCHPVEECFATGHANGEIRIWFNISDVKNVISSIQHWHSLEVLSLKFSSSGSTVLSGGHEGVLVQWLEDSKNFLPRLGSAITNVAVSKDSTLFAVSLLDNSILIITNYFTIKQTFDGFTAIGQNLPCGICYDSNTNACVTNGKPGHLLFYLPDKDIQLYNLDIVSRNFISSVDLEKPLSKTNILKVGFGGTFDGVKHMATMEFDQAKQRDEKLKFWRFSDTDQQWVLETIVKSPHDGCGITSLTFSPANNACVTTSQAGFAKIWFKHDEGWLCEMSLSFRDLPCNDSTFSEDGSVLALAFGHTVCFCDISNNEEMQLMLSHSESIKSIFFGRQSCQHLLVAATSEELLCWNVMTKSMYWSSHIHKINFLICDIHSENMAVFTNSNKIFVFQPSDKQPHYSHNLSIDVTAACFVPSKNCHIAWQAKSELYLVSKEMSVHKFCVKSEVDDASNLSRMIIKSDQVTPMSNYLSSTQQKTAKTVNSNRLQETTVDDTLRYILDTPCHVLPSMSTLCDQFISSLLLQQPSDQSEDISKHNKNDNFEVTEAKNDKKASKDEDLLEELEKRVEQVKVEDFEWIQPLCKRKLEEFSC
ncbi:unnamed protein product [Clavelina lepadiformis]|uniref:WD repeat-containing protein 75 second beta-propeller domain-containing protein n=1 Tax=Clavelina lepadiformis TaxID=159417 RepID=A0ABP0FDN4_CLALP